MWWFTDLDILCSSFKTTCRAADTSCRHPLKWPKYLLFESFHYNWFASTYLLTNQVYAVSFSYQRLAYAAWIVYISCVISYDTTTILKWIRLEKDPLNLLCAYPESISIFALWNLASENNIDIIPWSSEKWFQTILTAISFNTQ